MERASRVKKRPAQLKPLQEVESSKKLKQSQVGENINSVLDSSTMSSTMKRTHIEDAERVDDEDTDQGLFSINEKTTIKWDLLDATLQRLGVRVYI